MQEKKLFEYAVIRVVPRVEREEFLNAGVILYCADHRFLKAVYDLNEKRFLSFYADLDIPEIAERLASFDQICKGLNDAGPIGKLPLASRFRWLTSSRSTIIQTSAVHSGLSKDPEETLKRLFVQLVF